MKLQTCKSGKHFKVDNIGDFYKDVPTIASSHHEMVNGKGYSNYLRVTKPGISSVRNNQHF